MINIIFGDQARTDSTFTVTYTIKTNQWNIPANLASKTHNHKHTQSMFERCDVWTQQSWITTLTLLQQENEKKDKEIRKLAVVILTQIPAATRILTWKSR